MKFSSAIVVIFLHLAHLCEDSLCTKYCSGSEQKRFWHFLVGGRQTDNQSINQSIKYIVEKVMTASMEEKHQGGGGSKLCRYRRGWGSIPEMGNGPCKGPEAAMSGLFQPSEEGGVAGKCGGKCSALAEGSAWSFVDMGWLGEEHVGEGGTQRWAWKWKVSGAHRTPSGGFE